MTNTTQHTPGPWIAPSAGIYAHKIHIATVHPLGKYHLSNGVEEMSNARLIAAAPELLEACKEVLVEWQAKVDLMPQIIDSKAIRLTKQAVGKAEGR